MISQLFLVGDRQREGGLRNQRRTGEGRILRVRTSNPKRSQTRSARGRKAGKMGRLRAVREATGATVAGTEVALTRGDMIESEEGTDQDLDRQESIEAKTKSHDIDTDHRGGGARGRPNETGLERNPIDHIVTAVLHQQSVDSPN